MQMLVLKTQEDINLSQLLETKTIIKRIEIYTLKYWGIGLPCLSWHIVIGRKTPGAVEKK